MYDTYNKTAPKGRFCEQSRRGLLHRHSAGVALTAICLVCEHKKRCRKANKDVGKLFNRWPCAKEHIDNIPAGAAHELTETHKAPVKTANDDKDERNTMKCFHAFSKVINSGGGGPLPLV